MLLGWHIAIKDPWRIRLATILGMMGESLALAVPVVLLGMVMPRYFPLAATAQDPVDSAVIYCGAGVYEEFVFPSAADSFPEPDSFATLSRCIRFWRASTHGVHLRDPVLGIPLFEPRGARFPDEDVRIPDRWREFILGFCF